jgi:hypothetical protein
MYPFPEPGLPDYLFPRNPQFPAVATFAARCTAPGIDRATGSSRCVTAGATMMPEDGLPSRSLRWRRKDAPLWQSRPCNKSGRFHQANPLSAVWPATTSKTPIDRNMRQFVTENLQKHWLIQLPNDRVQSDQRSLGIAEADRCPQAITELDSHLVCNIRKLPGISPALYIFPVWFDRRIDVCLACHSLSITPRRASVHRQPVYTRPCN